MPLIVPTQVEQPGLPAPDPADRTTFGPRMRETLRWLLETFTAWVYSTASAVFTNAQAAQTASQMALAASNYEGDWSQLTGPRSSGITVSYNDKLWLLTVDIAAIENEEPSELTDVWAVFDSDFLSINGGDLQGPVTVPSGATGAQVPQAQEVLTKKDLTEIEVVLTGDTVEVDPAEGTIFTFDMTVNATLTANLAAGQSVLLMVKSNSYTLTWPTVTWHTSNDLAPTLTPTKYKPIVLFNVAGTLRGMSN